MDAANMHKPMTGRSRGARTSRRALAALSEAELLELEAKYCSHGDTVHYTNPPKIFESCEGSFLFDAEGRPYLDLQMWYSAVNFGYRNERLDAAVRRQLDRLPQVASQYLHREKIELAAMLAKSAEARFGLEGRIHFNVGGSQAVEDSLKLVRNAKNGKSLMFAFEGGYHGRTLGASAITSSYRYRRRYGHFGDRAHFVPFPYHFRGPKGMTKEEYGNHCVQQFARLFESEYNGVWDPKGRPGRVRRLLRGADPGHRRLRHSAEGLLRRAQEGARPARHPAGGGRDPDGLLPHRQAVRDRALRREARHHRVRQGHHQRPQPAGRHLGARGADQPAGLPAGLHALHLQRQSDGHRRRARGHAHDGRDRLRGHGDGEGRLSARRARGPQAPPQDRGRRGRARHGPAHGDLRAARQLHAVEGDRQTAWWTRD